MDDEGKCLAAFFISRFTAEMILAMQMLNFTCTFALKCICIFFIYFFYLAQTQLRQQVFAVLTALSDEEEKQEENDGMIFSSESEELMDWILCSVSVGALLPLALEGVLSTMKAGVIGGGTERTLVSRCLVRLSCLLIV
eukprot:10394518-Ditylum_brightwellii.AAC.1